MFEKVIDLTSDDSIFIRDGNDDRCGCGDVNNDGHLYYINQLQSKAYQLPDKYKDTPIILYHPCGGLSDGMIMVSLLGEIDLQYHHTFLMWPDCGGGLILMAMKLLRHNMFMRCHFTKDEQLFAKVNGL